MSLAVKDQLLAKDYCLKRLLKILNAIQLSRFCFFFSLRQGTILIAVTELTFTSFCLFVLLLCTTHAQDIVGLVTSDLQQLVDNNVSEKVIEESSKYIINNERKMLTGQHLALIIMFIVWAGLLFTSVHFISCTLLLYGAIRGSPNFLVPWTSTALFVLISGFFLITALIFVRTQNCKFQDFVILLAFYGTELYSWLVVLSYYRVLKTFQLNNFGSVIYNTNVAEKA